MKTITLFLMLLISSNLFSQKIMNQFTLDKDTYGQIVNKYKNSILTLVTDDEKILKQLTIESFPYKKEKSKIELYFIFDTLTAINFFSSDRILISEIDYLNKNLSKNTELQENNDVKFMWENNNYNVKLIYNNRIESIFYCTKKIY